ncbi:MAG: HTH domain-containing protein [Methanosarcinales archaeon]|nr:HTH domain-containing protein [Methanosarcinales archaeon]
MKTTNGTQFIIKVVAGEHQKHTVAEIDEMLGVSRMTVYRYVNEEKEKRKKGDKF